ncbi:MAG: hypothetical protein RL264_437 [Bacteroidota bacterium]|jgi:RHS repeat-associated protein
MTENLHCYSHDKLKSISANKEIVTSSMKSTNAFDNFNSIQVTSRLYLIVDKMHFSGVNNIYINNIFVGSGSIFVSSSSSLQTTGTVNVANAIAGISGTVTVRLDLFNRVGTLTQGTFRMDDFVLNGYTTAVEHWSPAGYRYGFQNQEKDDEIKGAGNSVNYKYRMHDPRVGRFFAVDPLAASYPWNSTYAFSENVVLNAVELEGLEKVYVYNVWFDSDGKKNVKFSHCYTDNNLKKNVNKVNYYNGGGKVTLTEYKGIKSNSSLTVYPTVSSKPEELNDVYNYFNPIEIVPQQPEEKSVNQKSGLEQYRDEAYNNGNWIDYLYYAGRDLDSKSTGIEGAKRVSGILDQISTVTGYIPGAGQAISKFTGAVSIVMRTGIDYEEENVNADSNLKWRVAGYVFSNAAGWGVDQSTLLNEGSKSVIGGAIGQFSSIITDELTKDE